MYDSSYTGAVYIIRDHSLVGNQSVCIIAHIQVPIVYIIRAADSLVVGDQSVCI